MRISGCHDGDFTERMIAMNKKVYEGYKYVDGGVCAAKGYLANGINCGLNPEKTKNDLGMVYSEKVCNAAAVYTTNKVKGAPITVTKEHLKATGIRAQAFIVNSIFFFLIWNGTFLLEYRSLSKLLYTIPKG